MDPVYLKREILVKVQISFFLKCLAICDGQTKTDCACSHVLQKCTETLLVMLYGKLFLRKNFKREGARAGEVGWGGVSSATSLQLRKPKIYEHWSTLGGFVTCVSE
jgi:hypothetical protein